MCGIFGVYSQRNNDVAREIFFALMALQHRGQEAAGIAVSDSLTINYKKNIGMVNQIFHEEHLKELPGKLGIGHTRYSTTKNKQGCLQPFIYASKLGPFAIAHNGEISNYHNAKQKLLNDGACFFTDSDTELLAHYISKSNCDCWERALEQVIKQIPGAYSLVVLTNEGLWALRDPLGIRLLSVGRKGDDWYIASESCCFNAIGVDRVADVEPGSLVKIGPDGYETNVIRTLSQATCAFEYVYFSRPDSNIDGVYINEIRQRIGEELWNMTKDRFKPKSFMVSGVPESATPMAIGFSNASGIRYNEIFAKNRYIHRTFIKPVNIERKSAVYLKFNPLVNNIKNKKIILIDDSIVRGNTIEHLAKILKAAGAKEIHILVGSPPVRNPCYMGIDMKEKSEFIMNTLEPHELAEKIGVSSITFLEPSRLSRAINRSDLCMACWTGEYPKELEW